MNFDQTLLALLCFAGAAMHEIHFGRPVGYTGMAVQGRDERSISGIATNGSVRTLRTGRPWPYYERSKEATGAAVGRVSQSAMVTPSRHLIAADGGPSRRKPTTRWL